MIVPAPLRLIGIGLQNETYQGPPIEKSGKTTSGQTQQVQVDSSSPLGANPQYLEDGAHLRWAFQKRLGWPTNGFSLYRRNSLLYQNRVDVRYASGHWVFAAGQGLGSSTFASVTPSSTSPNTDFDVTFGANVAACIISTGEITIPPGTITAFGQLGASGDFVTVSPTVRNLGDVTTALADRVVVQPDQVDMAAVYKPLVPSGVTDPAYDAYLAGAFDPDADNDESYGAGDTDTVTPASQNDADTTKAEYGAGATGAFAAGPTPWLNRLHVSADPSHVASLTIYLVTPVATTLKTAVSAGSPQTVTPDSISNIVVGEYLTIGTGTTNLETVQVLSLTTDSSGNPAFTANLSNAHSAGEAIGDLPQQNPWTTSGWQQIGAFRFPDGEATAVGRVLPSVYPSSWNTSYTPPGASPTTTATELKRLYSAIFQQLLQAYPNNSVNPPVTIDPNATRDLPQQNPQPGQQAGSVSFSALDTLLSMAVDPRIARMWGLEFVDPPQKNGAVVGPFDYMVAGFWTNTTYPDAYSIVYDVYITQHNPLAQPAGLAGVGVLEGFQPADQETTFTSTTGAIPAIGLTWDLQIDLTAPDLNLVVGAPVAFSVYRAPHASTHATSDFNQINTHPVVVPLSTDQQNGGVTLPQYYYIDSGPDSSSPGGHGLLDGSYDYQTTGVDLFGRISTAASWTSSWATVTALALPPPPPPAHVKARFIDPSDPYLSVVESAKVSAAGGRTADINWHWTGRLIDQANLDHFNLYYLDALPAMRGITLTAPVDNGDGTFTVDATLSDGNGPLNSAVLVNGRIFQPTYEFVIENLGGPIFPTIAVPERQADQQWLITAASSDGSGGYNLTLVRAADTEGLDIETEGDPTTAGAAQLQYDLGSKTLWTLLDTYPHTGSLAGTLPPPPASTLVVYARSGDTTIKVDLPGEISPGATLWVGTEQVTVSSSGVIGQTVYLTSGLAQDWPKGTPVSSLTTSAAVDSGATNLRLNTISGSLPQPGQVIEVGMFLPATIGATSLSAAITGTGSQTATPTSMTNIVTGTSLLVDTGANIELVVVTAVNNDSSGNPVSFTANFQTTHSAGVRINVGVKPASTTIQGDVAAGSSVTVTPGSMAGIARGSTLIVDTGSNGETITVTSINVNASNTPTSFVANLAHAHASGAPILAVSTALSSAVASGSSTATPASMLNINVGTQLMIDSGNVSEVVMVTQVNTDSTSGAPLSFSATFTQSHGAGAPIAILPSTERVLVTDISGDILTITPPLQNPWPAMAPVSIVDIPYDYAPTHTVFEGLGMAPTATQLLGQGFFGISTTAISPQDGSLVEGPVSSPAVIQTVSYLAHTAGIPSVPAPGTCATLPRIFTDAADVNGLSRAHVPLPTPPTGGPLAYAEVWRASDQQIFAATGQHIDTTNPCNDPALQDLANASIDRDLSTLPDPATTITLAAGASPGATSISVQLAAGSLDSHQDYREISFVIPDPSTTTDPTLLGVETVTIARNGVSGSGPYTISFFPALKGAYDSGQQVQILSQGMGPFARISKDPVPWPSASPATPPYIDDTLHGLSDNLYFYTFTSLPVQTDSGDLSSGHTVNASGNRSAAWPVTDPYQIKPTRPPLAPASVAATIYNASAATSAHTTLVAAEARRQVKGPGKSPPAISPPPSGVSGPNLPAPTYNEILLAWDYEVPPAALLTAPPQRTYTIYRTTDSNAASDVRLMPAIHQFTFTPANTTIASSISTGIQTVTPVSMTNITSGTAVTIFNLATADSFDSTGRLIPSGSVVNEETVIVLSTTGTTFNANFALAHPAGSRLVGGRAAYLDGANGSGPDWSLMAGIDYFYRITAADAHGNVSKPSNIIHTRTVEQIPPLAPTNLRARWVRDKGTGQWKVVLTWTNPRPDLKSQIQRQAVTGGLWRTVWPGISGVWSPAGASSGADTNADYYHVRHYIYRLVVQTASGFTNFSNTSKV